MLCHHHHYYYQHVVQILTILLAGFLSQIGVVSASDDVDGLSEGIERSEVGSGEGDEESRVASERQHFFVFQTAVVCGMLVSGYAVWRIKGKSRIRKKMHLYDMISASDRDKTMTTPSKRKPRRVIGVL